MLRILILLSIFLASFTSAIASSLIGGLSQPLPINQAFQFNALVKNKNEIILYWKIASGYYLYRDRFYFTPLKSNMTRLGQPIFPKSMTKTYPGLGKFKVYEGIIKIPVPIIQSEKKQFHLLVHYQGCSEKGFCYPPVARSVNINLDGPYMQPIKSTQTNAEMQINNNQLSTQHKVFNLLNGASIFTLLMGFLGLGLLISLTPCVLPMIPILSSIIIGQKKLTTAHSFGLSVAYVLGMAITYAIAGVIFGFVGGSVQAILQQPWVIILFSLVFIIMALSFFGFYQIQLPNTWRSKVAHASEHQKHGTYFGTFIMGILSSLILSPCVTPALVAVLTYISQTGNAALGGVALFIMAIGMGAPLLIIGASGAKLLPKAGAWMNSVKIFMGVLLLAVAIYMLSRILPSIITMLLWSALAIGYAIYLGALTSSQTPWQLVKKIIGLALFVYGILIAISAITGNNNPLHPLNFNNNQTHKTALHFIPVKTVRNVEQQLKLAKEQGRPVMLDFYASWCISCKEMEQFTFGDPRVEQRIKQNNYILLRADVSQNDKDDKALQQYFRVVAPPTIIFFDRKNHTEIIDGRIVGEMRANAFLKHLAQIEQR